MTRLKLNGHYADADLIIFDKDGTLIDFYCLWGQKTINAVERLVHHLAGDRLLCYALYQALGYDFSTQCFVRDALLATVSTATLRRVVADILQQHGYAPAVFEAALDDILVATLNAPPALDQLQPLADLPALFSALKESGVKIGLITSDSRHPVMLSLEQLGIARYVDALVCGDDRLANKPMPEAVYHVGEMVGVVPQRMVMIGDTSTDLLAATRAGVGCRVAVRSGVGDEELLARYADILVGSVAEVRPLG